MKLYSIYIITTNDGSYNKSSDTDLHLFCQAETREEALDIFIKYLRTYLNKIKDSNEIETVNGYILDCVLDNFFVDKKSIKLIDDVETSPILVEEYDILDGVSEVSMFDYYWE
jgi:hypothetical protein